MEVYAGLHKVSCDMCHDLVQPTRIIKHRDGSKVDICDVCYGKCLAYPKFNKGIRDKDIIVTSY